MLRPHLDRVELLATGDEDRADVEIFDPSDPYASPAGRTPRVALAWDTSVAAMARARDLGAVQVLPLGLAAAELVEACERAHLMRGYVVDAPDHVSHDVLSDREVDVVRGICRGLSNAGIAKELDVSVNSVKTYIRTAYRKIGVTSRSQALLWGLERGL